jgi:TPR repeat protein
MAALAGCGLERAVALLDAPRAIVLGIGEIVEAVEGEKDSGKGDGGEAAAKSLAELKARADEGDVQAMYEYGNRLNDLEKAWVWFCPAAHKGHAESQYALANYYRWGHSPTQQNFLKSYLWRTLSLNGGDPRAASARHFTQEMTADQIAEANSLVTKWKPNPAECERDVKLAAD